jgi:hypothetical protein
MGIPPYQGKKAPAAADSVFHLSFMENFFILHPNNIEHMLRTKQICDRALNFFGAV